MPGFQTARVLVESKFGGAIFGNLLLGGLIGAVVDSASSASCYLEPDEIHVVMTRGAGVAEWRPPVAAPPPPPPPAQTTPEPDTPTRSATANRPKSGRFTRR